MTANPLTRAIPAPAPPVRRDVALAWRECLHVALLGWVVAHAIVGLAIACLFASGHGWMQSGSAPGSSGLFVWDGAWYRAIAQHGYGPLGREAVRFFPLLPGIGALGEVVGLPATVLLPLVTNACGLIFAMLVVRIVAEELGDSRLARRSGLLLQLVPGAGVLVLPYTESVAGALAAGYFLLLRRDRAWWAAGLGLLSGLARPTGPLLAVAGACSLVTSRGARDRARSTVVTLAPIAGTVAYCGWVWWRFGDFLLPYTAQTAPGMRGGFFASPLAGLTANSHGGLDWRANIVIVAVVLLLLALSVRLLPARYVWWSAAMVVASLTSARLHSLPRYCAAIFPLVIVLAALPRRRWSWPVTLGVCAASMWAIAGIGFTPFYTL